MIKQIKNKLSTHQIRALSFLLAIVFYLTSYILYPKGFYPGRVSGFLKLLGVLFIFPAFNYKIKEKPLKLHHFIENKVKGDSTKIFLVIIMIFSPVILIGLYFSFKSINKFDYLTQANFGFQIILLFVIFFTLSFWKRRQVLKRQD